MVLEPILCPTYGGDDVVKHGQLCEGSHRPQLPTVLTKVDLSRCLLRRAIALCKPKHQHGNHNNGLIAHE